jgi:hypothetical protein
VRQRGGVRENLGDRVELKSNHIGGLTIFEGMTAAA